MNLYAVQSVLLNILTSIITGGFVLVFVEIGNRKNRENDRHEQIMVPFMHKLSAYFRFMSWCHSRLIYSQNQTEYEKEFKKLVDKLGHYGGRIIVSGGDYGIEDFSAEELCNLAYDINNVWYYYDKMNPCLLQWDDSAFGYENFIEKELKEINPSYLNFKEDIDLVSRVSGQFFTDVYQPIEYQIFRHEVYVKHFRKQSMVVACAVTFVLIVLAVMLFIELPLWAVRSIGVVVIGIFVISLLLLGVDIKKQIQLVKRVENCWNYSCFKKFFFYIFVL